MNLYVGIILGITVLLVVGFVLYRKGNKELQRTFEKIKALYPDGTVERPWYTYSRFVIPSEDSPLVLSGKPGGGSGGSSSHGAIYLPGGPEALIVVGPSTFLNMPVWAHTVDNGHRSPRKLSVVERAGQLGHGKLHVFSDQPRLVQSIIDMEVREKFDALVQFGQPHMTYQKSYAFKKSDRSPAFSARRMTDADYQNCLTISVSPFSADANLYRTLIETLTLLRKNYKQQVRLDGPFTIFTKSRRQCRIQSTFTSRWMTWTRCYVVTMLRGRGQN